MIRSLLTSLALALVSLGVAAQVTLPLPACADRPPLPLQTPAKPIGLPVPLPPLPASPTAPGQPIDCGAPMLEANAIGGAAAFMCKSAAGPVLYLYAVRWSALTPAMVADFAALALPGDNAERIRAMQATYQTSNVYDMCDVWGPMRDRINAAIPAPPQFVVAPNGTTLTRPAFAVANGARSYGSTSSATVGAPCDCALSLKEGQITFCRVNPITEATPLVSSCVNTPAKPIVKGIL